MHDAHISFHFLFCVVVLLNRNIQLHVYIRLHSLTPLHGPLTQAAPLGFEQPLDLNLKFRIRPIASKAYMISDSSGVSRQSDFSGETKKSKAKKKRPRLKSLSFRRIGRDKGGLGKRENDQANDSWWLVSLSVNEPQQRGFVYTSPLNQKCMLWLHSVVKTDGPNVVIHLTALPPEVPNIVGSPLRARASRKTINSGTKAADPKLAPADNLMQSQTGMPKQTVHLQLNLSAVGISFVDRRPREVRHTECSIFGRFDLSI